MSRQPINRIMLGKDKKARFTFLSIVNRIHMKFSEMNGDDKIQLQKNTVYAVERRILGSDWNTFCYIRWMGTSFSTTEGRKGTWYRETYVIKLLDPPNIKWLDSMNLYHRSVLFVVEEMFIDMCRYKGVDYRCRSISDTDIIVIELLED